MKALVVIDPQNDFCPGGALAVAEGDSIMQPINEMMGAFDLVILTQDWHPQGHSSFASSHDGAAPFSLTDMPYGPQVLWPDHCIQGSDGAAFHPALDTMRADVVIRKGSNPAVDSYSAFFENDKATATGLAGLLRDRGCEELTMVGLATDYCVAWSALDGVANGFRVEVRLPTCRAIDLDGSLDRSLADMRAAGVTLVE
ncbi:MAG: nicotinamidase/pyrazinamidase [SAR116 cluster bacterium]|jgi:nicotinamidase/pyrazinamidase|nr:nicotinamidase/pyrazinamidase [SAR116 cluster bacterium]RPG99736.1 MAG: bifunctional nicotinamidase/pyrazinamidase [Candidatus Puniceispirillum sp. TMED176]RZO30931.1 MAG: bifunctional nicotinamidase/pyrazinamidase [SAR116 cluster bacterium]|tara:strand:+ start:2713 stop:3309 length:597 start_codon:yes stop_codon:yes gene_type:complete